MLHGASVGSTTASESFPPVGETPSASTPLPASSSYYQRPLGEDPVYLAALDEALRTSALGGGGTRAAPQHQAPPPFLTGAGVTQHHQPPPPPPPLRPLSSQPHAAVPKPTHGATAPVPASVMGKLKGLSIGAPRGASAATGGGTASAAAASSSTGVHRPDPASGPRPASGPPGRSATSGKGADKSPTGHPPPPPPPHAGPKPPASEEKKKPPTKGQYAAVPPPPAPQHGRPLPPQQQQQQLPLEDLQRAMKTGCVFRGLLRINAGDPREAYVTVPGLPSDMMLRGLDARGNSLEGDEVAVRLLPLQSWFTPTSSSKAPTAAAASAGKGAAALATSGEPWLALCAAGTGSAGAVLAEVRRHIEARAGVRVTGRVAAVLTPGTRREQIVGVLQAGGGGGSGAATLYLLPMDPRLPRCLVGATSAKGLAEELLAEARGATVESRCGVGCVDTVKVGPSRLISVN